MNSQRCNGESRAVRDSNVIAPWPNVCVCMHRYISQIPCRIKKNLTALNSCEIFQMTCLHKLKTAKLTISKISLKDAKEKKRELLKRYKSIGQLNTFQRKWSRNSLCFDHMNSSINAENSISKVPFGRTSPLPEWPLPTFCCNSLCDANWRCWIPHDIGMHRFQTFS